MSRVVTERWRGFEKEVMAFREFDRETVHFMREIAGVEVPYYVNQFWTTAHRAGHSLHEVPYRACFKPQLPRFFIERLSESGDLIGDPYVGRGTTVLEAALLGRNAMGNDVNPLSRFLTEPRLDPPCLAEVQQRLREIPWGRMDELPATTVSNEDLLAFYHPHTLEQLQALKSYFLSRQNQQAFDRVDGWIRMVACTRLSGHSSGMFSVRSLPPNQAVLPEQQRRLNEKHGRSPEPKDVAEIIMRKSKSLLRKLTDSDCRMLNSVGCKMLTGEASELNMLDHQVDLVVTSPPFLDVVDYKKDHWLRSWFCGIDEAMIPAGREYSVTGWKEEFSKTLNELKRVVKVGGMMVIEVGEIHRGEIQMEDWVVELALQLGLKVRGVCINDAQFSKTAHCWGIENRQQGTNTNRMVILEC